MISAKVAPFAQASIFTFVQFYIDAAPGGNLPSGCDSQPHRHSTHPSPRNDSKVPSTPTITKPRNLRSKPPSPFLSFPSLSHPAAMRLSAPFFSVLLALPALSTAEPPPAQKPLLENIQSWLSAAQTYLPSAVQSYLPIPSATKPNVLSSVSPTPVASPETAAAAANTPIIIPPPASITPLTVENWRTHLSPSPSRASLDLDGRETWMVLISGGNRTCLGHCARLEAEWNRTAALLTKDPISANTAPQLGYVNCDDSPVLCAMWAARPVTLWYIQFPAIHVKSEEEYSSSGSSSSSSSESSGSGSSDAPPSSETTVSIISLNMTTTTAEELLHIHTQKTFEATPIYDGIFHPFDGPLAKTGVALPVGYVIAGFSMIPSWAYMILISFVSRSFM